MSDSAMNMWVLQRRPPPTPSTSPDPSLRLARRPSSGADAQPAVFDVSLAPAAPTSELHHFSTWTFKIDPLSFPFSAYIF